MAPRTHHPHRTQREIRRDDRGVYLIYRAGIFRPWPTGLSQKPQTNAEIQKNNPEYYRKYVPDPAFDEYIPQNLQHLPMPLVTGFELTTTWDSRHYIGDRVAVDIDQGQRYPSDDTKTMSVAVYNHSGNRLERWMHQRIIDMAIERHVPPLPPPTPLIFRTKAPST